MGMYSDGHGATPLIAAPLDHGKPIMAPYIGAITPRQDSPVMDVTLTPMKHTEGPPKVNSDLYRAGWDRIFNSDET